MRILTRKNRNGMPQGATRDRGLTLIETALALGIMALVVASLSMMMAENADQIRARAAADKITEVHEAAKGYIKANYPALLAAAAAGPVTIPSGRATAGGPIPSGPAGLPSLQGGGYLNSTYVDTNGYGQRHYVVVRKLSGTPSGLEAMVSTEGGRAIPDGQLGRIANFVGAAGGYVPENPVVAADAGQVVGSYGGWRTPVSGWGSTAAPASGHLQATFAFDDGTLLADYLYRKDVGIPEANRMSTHIDMDGNNLDNAGDVNSQTVHVANDATVGGNVRAALDVFARNMNATTNITADNGNIVATRGDVKAGRNVVASLDVAAGQDVVATRDVKAGRDMTAQGAVKGNTLEAVQSARVGTDLDVAGKTTTGDFKATRLNIDAIVYNDSPNGNNRNLSVASGVRLGDLLPRTVPQYSYRVTEGTANVVTKPLCGGDFGKARIMVYRQIDSVRANPNLVATPTYVDVFDGIYAVDNASSNTWTVKWEGLPAVPGTARQALAQTFCFYGP